MKTPRKTKIKKEINNKIEIKDNEEQEDNKFYELFD